MKNLGADGHLKGNGSNQGEDANVAAEGHPEASSIIVTTVF